MSLPVITALFQKHLTLIQAYKSSESSNRYAVSSHLLQVNSELSFKVQEQFDSFKQFCTDNRELFISFYSIFEEGFKIHSFDIKENKQAILITLSKISKEEELCEMDEVHHILIPFLFIQSPELYLFERRQYVKNYHFFNTIELANKKAEKIKQLQAELDEELLSIDSYNELFPDYIKNLSKDDTARYYHLNINQTETTSCS